MLKSETLTKMGYPDNCAEKMVDFFGDIFKNEDELENFFKKVFKHDDEIKEPRYILNQIEQLISIADDIEKIRPCRDPLRVLFMRICLEAIYKLAGLNNQNVGKFFEEYISDEGKQYIKDNFRLTSLESDEELPFLKKMLLDEKECLEFGMDNFSELFRSIRNDVTHEGNYYEMDLWNRYTDSILIAGCKSNECIIKSSSRKNREEWAADELGWNKDEFGLVSFTFETTMTYDKFRYYFLQGCITFLEKYIDKIEQGLIK